MMMTVPCLNGIYIRSKPKEQTTSFAAGHPGLWLMASFPSIPRAFFVLSSCFLHNKHRQRFLPHISSLVACCSVPSTTSAMPSVRSQPSVKSGASRSTSPSPSPSRRSPTEATTLLAPSTPVQPAHGFQHHSHLRKSSVGGRSVSGRSTAGSTHRGYGSVNTKPGPVNQAPRASKLGQRVGLLRDITQFNGR